MSGQPNPEDVCETCRRLFDRVTGQIVEGWARATWVTAGPNLCAGCKGAFIEKLEKAVPVQ